MNVPLHLLVPAALLCSLPSTAQNLVPNPDFEQYNNCPTNLLSMPFSSGYNNFPTVVNWTNPLKLTTPDYLHECAPPTSGLQVPNTSFGYQQPRSGHAYAGLIIFQGNITAGGVQYDYREYLQTRLLQPMVAGHQYCVSFYVSPTISSSFSLNNIALDEIGIHFSAKRPTDTSQFNLSFPYHIKNTTNNFIHDTAKWYRISGIYKATGGEEWLTLGSFYNGGAPSFQYLYPQPPNQTVMDWMYAFVDDVSVVEVSAADTQVFVHDTLLCSKPPSSFVFKSSATNALQYLWNDGSQFNTLVFTDTGTYWCISTQECGLITDSFYVHYRQQQTLDLGNDTANCNLQPVTLHSNHAYLSYLWNTGDTSASITVSQTGSYLLTVLDSCGLQHDTVEVWIQPPTDPPIVRDTTICQFVPQPQLNVQGQNLRWYQSATVNYGTNTQPYLLTADQGNYLLYVSQTVGHCESARVPLWVNIKGLPDQKLQSFYAFCTGSEDQLGTYFPDVSYRWNTGEQTCCVQPKTTGLYIRTLENQCGSVSDSAYVDVSSCDECLLMPNAFTPNHDFRNDLLRPIQKCEIYNYRLTIYNRWGEQVFSTTDVKEGWDGTYKSRLAPMGTYVYLLQYNSTFTKQALYKQGNVSLIR